MQLTLFPDFFREELEKTEGFLSHPLKILERFMETEPGLEILRMIESDQIYYAKLKKLKRGSSAPLCQSGCKRMPAAVVFILLVARGSSPGCYGDRGYGFLKENNSLMKALSHHGVSYFPGCSTIHENLSLLSPQTLNQILSFQTSMIQNEGLDDFDMVTIDSTAVAADSAFPNTAKLTCYYVRKIMELLKGEKLPQKRLQKHADKIINLTFSILNCGRKKRAEQKRKTLFRELLARIGKILNFLDSKKLNEISEANLDRLQPFYEGLNEMYFQITKEFFPERFDGEVKQRLSIADEQASFIKKGSKPAVFGYKFHLARSAKGFICGMLLNTGNPSDSKCFKKVVEDVGEKLDKIPKELSLDSGYCSKSNKLWAEKNGVEKLSFSGGKGKIGCSGKRGSRCCMAELPDGSDH